MSTSESSSFYASELQDALKGVSFGIQEFSVTSTSEQHALATVTLLEGGCMTIKLTERGFSIDPPSLPESSQLPINVFETVEGLLHSVSRQFVQKQHDAWVEKLEQLQRSREDELSG